MPRHLTMTLAALKPLVKPVKRQPYNPERPRYPVFAVRDEDLDRVLKLLGTKASK